MSAVRVEPFDPSWAALFARLRSSVLSVVDGSVEHIGSTAVPGLAAKPTVDILLGVSGSPDAVVAPLVAAGWEYVPEWESEIPDRRYFRLGPGPMREAHLHAVVLGSPFWERQLRFRDVLREEPAVARAYEALKLRLAETCGGSRERYTAGKSDFIRGILAAPDATARGALASAAPSGTNPSAAPAGATPPAVS